MILMPQLFADEVLNTVMDCFCLEACKIPNASLKQFYSVEFVKT